ncbi:MAG: hypothetical protein RLZ14_223 [Actinomycetota bacterium]
MDPAFDDIAPLPDGVEPSQLLHERAYVVRSYRIDNQTLLLRGAVRDQKPAGQYIPGDPEPLTVHHMVVDLRIAIPSLEITQARAVLETHPHSSCPTIQEHYRKLEGLSIARGFTTKVRDLFGGPRGCTHTTALLQAMAPVAVQSMWSFRIVTARESGITRENFSTPEGRQQAIAMNLNTCHVWAEDGDQVRGILAGEPQEVPVWIQRRYTELGRDPMSWRSET